ncbi:MAG: hypothetical protein IT158_18810 [Bryobacterales bacterium]|nr:hypothetical protein [Bryobacterales bacterium]
MPWSRFSVRAKRGAEAAFVLLLAAAPGRAAEAPGDLRDIAPPVEMPEDPVWPWYAGIGSGGAILAAAAGYAARRRRAALRARQAGVGPPPAPPGQTALEALEALETDLPAKLYYTRLAEILRVYIADRFEVNEPDATSSELLRILFRMRRIAAGQQGVLRALFAEADLAKFAGWTPDGDARRRALEAARGFVEETRNAF